MAEKIRPAPELPGFLNRDSVIDFTRGSRMLGFSAVHCRRLIKAGRVPAPFRIGTRKLGWRAGTLQDFLAAAASQAEAA